MNKISYAGDVETKQIDLVGKYSTVSLIALFNQVEIYEDLFSPFITGTITISESFDLINNLPLIGEEFLILDITTPGFEKRIKGRFYVFKCFVGRKF